MPSDFPFQFFLSVALSSTLLVAGVHYYLRTRQDALRWRIEELQDQDLSIRALGLAGALVLGYFVPDQVLVSLRKRHRLNLMAALPDTTDMLSIVLGAGLSLDQAIARVGEEIRFVYPELADEF